MQTDRLQVKGVNGVIYADQLSGADAGAKINAAIAHLPSTGGIVDARNLTGAQSMAASLTISKNFVTLLLGSMTLSMGANPIIIAVGTSGVQIVGTGPWGSNGADTDGGGTTMQYNLHVKLEAM
jgi:hypothetical protein